MKQNQMIRKILREEYSKLRKEYRIRVPHERIGWLAQVIKSVEQEPQDSAEPGMISFDFNTYDNGNFVWDLLTVQEKGYFDTVKETNETNEAIALLKNLQVEYQDASKIVAELRKLLGRVKRDVPEDDDL